MIYQYEINYTFHLILVSHKILIYYDPASSHWLIFFVKHKLSADIERNSILNNKYATMITTLKHIVIDFFGHTPCLACAKSNFMFSACDAQRKDKY